MATTRPSSSSGATDKLARYWAKRDFDVTAEPRGGTAPAGGTLSFVVQKHAASRLHYDFRLELDGVLVSWAVPKGPSFDPADKRMAIHVEDHPLSYGTFEGTIPPGQYGAGTVIVWDHGQWEPVGDPREGLANGKLAFHLHGHKLRGQWELVKMAKGGEKQEPWLLFKKRDEFARPRSDYDVLIAHPDSVIRKPLTPPGTAGRAARRKAPVKETASGKPNGTSGHEETVTAKGPKAAVPGAVKAPLPETLAPQLATLAAAVPETGDWIYEIKFDGYRIMARIERGRARLITRGGHDWSARMPELVRHVESLGVGSGWLDGEIIVIGAHGAPDFNALQKAFDQRSSDAAIVYYLFDLPFFEGHDLRQVALADRRQILKALLDEQGSDLVRFSADFKADPATILASACQMNVEGLIAKRADAPYASHRADTWLKLKCKRRQEFVICGYTDRSDGSPQIGSLLLGVHDQGTLMSVGSVGTGWNTEEARALKAQLAHLATDRPPFPAGANPPGRWPRRTAGSERWVRPERVAEVEFAEWTPDGQIRHATFVALRDDKPASAIVREKALAPDTLTPGKLEQRATSKRPKGQSTSAGSSSLDGRSATKTASRVARASAAASPPASSRRGASPGLKVTHADRVIDPSTGLTKLDLVRYYQSVAEWMLPHLANRPVSLVRGPRGVGGQLFFQKHDDKLSIPGLESLDPRIWPEHPPLLAVPAAEALASAAQMNVIEFHTWNSVVKTVHKPDRMVFDLDPGEGTTWKHIQEAALLVRALLQQLGLAAWLKTSGGKGLHVVVPLTPRHDYDTVKGFSQAIVQHLAKTIPSRFVAKSGPANRVGKLFADYLRNGFGATTAAAFSARARPGLGVSMPVSWDELDRLKNAAQWTIVDARQHLSFQTTDPWADYWTTRQTLTAGMKALGYGLPKATK